MVHIIIEEHTHTHTHGVAIASTCNCPTATHQKLKYERRYIITAPQTLVVGDVRSKSNRRAQKECTAL